MKTVEVLLKTAGVPDQSNRLYPLEELVKLCDSINLARNSLAGELGAKLPKFLTSARMDGDKLMVTYAINEVRSLFTISRSAVIQISEHIIGN